MFVVVFDCARVCAVVVYVFVCCCLCMDATVYCVHVFGCLCVCVCLLPSLRVWNVLMIICSYLCVSTVSTGVRACSCIWLVV